MKRSTVKIISLTLAFIMTTALLQVVPAIAADQGQLIFSKKYSGSITTTNIADRYTAVLPQSGTLSVSITRDNNIQGLPDNVTDVLWLDADNSELASHTLTFPYNFSMELEAGTYYIEIVQREGFTGTNTGTYNIRADYYAAEIIEPNNTIETAQLLESGLIAKGSITQQSDRNYFKMIMAKSGRLSITLTTAISSTSLQLLDDTGTQIYSDYHFGSYDFSIDLEAGTYYIVIVKRNSNTGEFNIRTDITFANNNEIEPNNTTETAQLLTSGQAVRGFISHQDDRDYYKVVFAQPGKLTISITSKISSTSIQLLDANGIQISSDYYYDSYNFSIGLESGTYFIVIIKRNSTTGIYDLQPVFSAAGNNEKEPNNTRAEAQLLSLGQPAKGFISYQDGIDMYRIVLTKPGKLAVNITSEITSTSIQWLDTNGTQIKSDYFYDSYNYSMSLDAGTYFIAVIKRSDNTGTYSLTVTDSLSQFTITAAAGTGGAATGGGTFQSNTAVTLRATATSGYTFDGWYEKNSRVSTSANWSFNVTTDRTLEARFIQQIQPVTALSNNVALNKLVGIWEGSYAASQGETGLTLTVYSEKGSFKAIFDFYNLPGRTNSKAGKYYMDVSYDESTGMYTLNGYEWIEHPSSYRFVDLDGIVDNDVFSGSSFSLTRMLPATIQNPHSSWATEELIRAVELDLIPESLSSPDIDYTKPITRAEFAGVTVKTYESLTNTIAFPATVNPFTDTGNIDVLKAFNAGIMVGFSATEFSPYTILTREQAATALTRVYKRMTVPGWSFATDANHPLNFIPPTPFTDDAAISIWAREGVYFMASYEIILGIGNNMFAPRALTSTQEATGYAVATREQALLIALRMVENLQ